MAVEIDFLKLTKNRFLQLLSQAREARAFLDHFPGRELARHTQSHDAGNVEGAGAHAFFVSTPIDRRLQTDTRVAASNVERPDTLGPVNLVRRQREKINAHGLYVKRYFRHGLHRVAVKQNPVLFGKSPDLRDGMDRSYLVVGCHDGNEQRPLVNCRVELFEIDDPVTIHTDIAYSKPLSLQGFAGVEDRLVLSRAGDDMITLVAIKFRDALNGQVIRFRAPTREHDFARRGCVNNACNLASRFINRRCRLPPKGMVAAGRVPKPS